MAKIHEFGLKLRFSGGDADEHRLELYDGTNSFHGFAQALQIATHAYLNREVVSRATALKGATFYLKAPRQGSVLLDIIAVIEKYPATVAVAAPIFYDFIKYSFSKATGRLNVEPETPYVSRLSTDDEPFFDDLAETLEGSLQRGHRAIDEGIPKITLERPRSPLLEFDSGTSAWVNTREGNDDVEEMQANITRYNSVTGNGRAYVNELKRIVPFRSGQDFPALKAGYLTWSLHGNATAVPQQLKLFATKIRSANGEVKRLILSDTTRLN